MFILKVHRPSHVPTLGLKYKLASYMDSLCLKLFGAVLLLSGRLRSQVQIPQKWSRPEPNSKTRILVTSDPPEKKEPTRLIYF